MKQSTVRVAVNSGTTGNDRVPCCAPKKMNYHHFSTSDVAIVYQSDHPLFNMYHGL